MAEVFFSASDLGNLMGRICHRVFGLKYGFTGLRYVVRAEDGVTKRGEIHLSRDPRRIFAFLGFDFDRYLEGFKELEDIFEFVVDSKFFSPNMFVREHLTGKNKKRSVKRSTFSRFLDYVERRYKLGGTEEEQKTGEEAESGKVEGGEDVNEHGDEEEEEQEQEEEEEEEEVQGERDRAMKRDRLLEIDRAFPEAGFLTKYDAIIREARIKREIAEKFSGKIIQSLVPGLKGQALGRFISAFKKSHGDDAFDDYILKTNQQTIEEEIVDQANKKSDLYL